MMRLRLPLGRFALFLAALAFALVALLPLGVAASWFDLGGRGLAAREASGSLWSGALKEAQFGPVPLGDVKARLNLLPLLLGRARLSLSRDGDEGALDGAVVVSRHGFAVEDMTGTLALGPLFGPAPLTAVELDGLSARFRNGLCESAEGEVGARLAGASLRGSARCADGALLVPLAGQSGADQLGLRIGGDGRWRIDAAIGGSVRRTEGSF
jgi:general secretion pathway protein N